MRSAIFFGLIFLGIVFAPVMVFFATIYAFIFMWNPENKIARRIFEELDQDLNVIMGRLFNLLYPNLNHKFGFSDETISSVIGKNLEEGDARMQPLDNFLSAADPMEGSHCINAIERDRGNT